MGGGSVNLPEQRRHLDLGLLVRADGLGEVALLTRQRVLAGVDLHAEPPVGPGLDMAARAVSGGCHAGQPSRAHSRSHSHTLAIETWSTI